MIQVNIENGQITPAGSTLSAGTPFQWLNNTAHNVKLSNCGNWCNADTYDVPANGGTANASVLAVPNLQSGAFTDPGWNTPGMPHIIVSPWPVAKREVA